MKGIVLEGGTGSRLWPMTRVTSKQLLPVYDKPMVYYPISTLMLAGIREILIITTPSSQAAYQELLGDGSRFGISFEYAIQESPAGLAQALIIGEDYLGEDRFMMILGDNIFHGVGLGSQLRKNLPTEGSHIYTYKVSDPSQYGILTTSDEGKILGITEKPLSSLSKSAITGLYYFDKQAIQFAKDIRPSQRGELEITSVLEKYLENDKLSFTELSRGTAWLDTGSPSALSDASQYIRVIEERTGLKIGCLEEIALRNGWIGSQHLLASIPKNFESSYIKYLRSLI